MAVHQKVGVILGRPVVVVRNHPILELNGCNVGIESAKAFCLGALSVRRRHQLCGCGAANLGRARRLVCYGVNEKSSK
jgi:hypothetical protein